jgi:D-tyrosyl-tRNA(Tyr) deacylase
MKLLTQRVKSASVTVENKVVGEIQQGVLAFLGIHATDTKEKCEWLAEKLVHLRQFTDENGKMNLSVKDIGGKILVVSQFTLYADCSKGRRPSFIDSAAPEYAIPLYEYFLTLIKQKLGSVEAGIFGAKMEVNLLNDGPVTFIIEH